jgi:HlyD family secretion protein
MERWRSALQGQGLLLRGCTVLMIGLVCARANGEGRLISCLGRLEPGLGVVKVASPSRGGGVIATLDVSEGDRVEPHQVLATLDDHSLRKADVARLEAEMTNAEREAGRAQRLSVNSATSAANLDAAEVGLRIAQANLDAARSRLELTRIRAPIRGQVLDIHARPGERVGAEGVLEIGDTEHMVAVAEVYETDITAVSEGNRAVIRSAALPEPITGVVRSVGWKVARVDTLGTDPIAKADARVVEVRIALDASDVVSRLTNLQVEVEIQP